MSCLTNVHAMMLQYGRGESRQGGSKIEELQAPNSIFNAWLWHVMAGYVAVCGSIFMVVFNVLCTLEFA